tara:strand:+ start:6 stop:371 length:366 start_codon:yes stop_codon:yes gene_type:complete
MKKLLGIVVLGLLLSTKSSFGSITVAAYLKGMKSDDTRVHTLIEQNLIGINSGLMYANTELRWEGRKQLYCQPKQLGLNGKNLISFVNAEIEFMIDKGKDPSKVPIGMMLTMHLKRIFKCD